MPFGSHVGHIQALRNTVFAGQYDRRAQDHRDPQSLGIGLETCFESQCLEDLTKVFFGEHVVIDIEKRKAFE